MKETYMVQFKYLQHSMRIDNASASIKKKENKELQKQPSRGILMKRYSENIQQNYRSTLMPKCDFNKAVLQLYWNHTLAWVFSCKFAAYFQNTFS